MFFQNLTLGYITKTLNQIIIFFLHQNQNIFSATLGITIFFLENKPYPPPRLEVKWSIPYGCEVWGFENIDAIESLFLQFCKIILGVKKSTPSLHLLWNLSVLI